MPGLGPELIPSEGIERPRSERIRELAQRFVGCVKDARDRTAAPSTGAIIEK
jgi:hypothetical protein